MVTSVQLPLRHTARRAFCDNAKPQSSAKAGAENMGGQLKKNPVCSPICFAQASRTMTDYRVLQMSGGAAWINFILGGGILAAMGGAAYFQILKERERLGKLHWRSVAYCCYSASQRSSVCSAQKHRYGTNWRTMGADGHAWAATEVNRILVRRSLCRHGLRLVTLAHTSMMAFVQRQVHLDVLRLHLLPRYLS
jgi:hypothetical protein